MTMPPPAGATKHSYTQLSQQSSGPVWVIAYSTVGNITRLTRWTFLKYGKADLPATGEQIGILIALYIFSRRVTHRDMLWAVDRLAIPTALVGALIRMGNLMNHEIYGHATSLPWGFRFIENVSVWHTYGAQPIFTEPSHPTQIYEALCYLAVFGLLMYMYWKRRAGDRPGLILGVFFVCVFLSRFFIEFVKNDQEAFEADMLLNMGQWLSIPFVIAGAWLIIRALRRPILPGRIEMPVSRQKK